MSPLTDSLLLVALGLLGLLLAALILYYLRPAYRTFVSPRPVVVKEYETIYVHATIQRRDWLSRTWQDVSGTLLLRLSPNDVISVAPTHGSTSDGALTFSFMLTGRVTGTAAFEVSGTPLGRSQATLAEVIVYVVSNPSGGRRIRHTPAALAALNVDQPREPAPLSAQKREAPQAFASGGVACAPCRLW